MKQIVKYKNLTWVDITEPTQDDISYLENNFRLHSLTLKTIIPAIHHPDLDVFKSYIFIILHYAHTQILVIAMIFYFRKKKMDIKLR